MDLFTLIKEEGWQVRKHQDSYLVVTEHEDELGPLKVKHPVLIHLEMYRRLASSEDRYTHMKKAHDILWPTTTWHEWTERRFRAHCENWNYITLSAGASASKSFDVGKISVLFFFAGPKERNVTIASVTMESLMTRVWGYVTAHIHSMAVPLPYKYYSSKPPKILFEEPSSGRFKITDDTLHGIFAVTAKIGDNDQAVATWIGKHPKDKILLILDEATDMPMSILNALPNLNSHPEKFQLMAVGNSNSTMDLHGLLSTPKVGWDNVSIDLQQWNTTQPKGICLYFNPYESPAITDPDPEKRKLLSKFLISKERLKEQEQELGKDSEKFYRWVLGFWKSRHMEEVVVTEAFLNDKDFYSRDRVEWSGFYPIQRVAGLDPAFSTQGDKCVLRIAYVGHSMDNKIKIDLGGGSTTHEIKLSATSGIPLERQIGEQAIDLLIRYGVKMEHLAIDVTGQGRALGDLIALLNAMKGYPLGEAAPLKIYSMSHHNLNKRKTSAPDIVPMNSYLLWMEVRNYLNQNNIAGLDDITRNQFTSRRLISVEVKGKKQPERLESKLEYKRRMSAIGKPHSPDEADAAALAIQVVKQRLGIEPGTLWTRPQRGLDYKTQEKMLLWASGNSGLSGQGAPMVLEADFSGTLESYARHTKFIP